MNLRIAIIVAGIVVPLLSGCQQRQASRQMQKELRFQEDRIYQLEDWIRQYNEQLNSCRSENTALSTGRPTSTSPKKAPLRISPFGDSESKAPEIPEVEIPKVEIPSVEIPPTELPTPNPMPPTGNRGARRPAPGTGARNVRRPPTSSPSSASGGRKPAVDSTAPAVALALATSDEPGQVKLSSYEAPTPKDSGIAGITLNRLLTVPVNRDGQPGDDGLMIVVEPRNHAGDLIPPAGELSVSLIDRAAASEAEAHVGRWNFSAMETTRLYRRTTLGDGIQLNLVWQDRKPAHSHLELYVRLTTPDGRKLETSRTIDVQLAAEPPASEREPQRLQPEAVVAEPIAPQPVTPAPAPAVAEPEPARLPIAKTPIANSQPDPFEIRPLPAAVAPQEEKAAVDGPTPLNVVDRPRPLTTAPLKPPTVDLEPRVATAPAPIRSSPPAPPRKPLPVRPPVEEQVALPVEPGTTPETTEPPASPPPKPQWAPYRRQK